ncbi:MAG: DUF1223 domain-containing protein [Pseudomonadota bacterium]
MIRIRKWFFGLFLLAVLVGLSSFIKNSVYAEDNRIVGTGDREDLLRSMAWLDNQDQPVVVELFTSTDCPGCSVADSILFKIRDHEKIIALGCHVDYWGNVGFDDPGTSECTDRQWYYDSARWDGEAELVTPQFITNGELKFRALFAYEILSKIRVSHEKRRPLKWILFEEINEDTLRLYLPDDDHVVTNKGKPHGVWLIRYHDSEVIKIPPQSENESPRIVRYTNIVKRIFHAGRWYGIPRTLDVDLTNFSDEIRNKPGGWVALIQHMNGDRIVAAGKLPDPKQDPRAQ